MEVEVAYQQVHGVGRKVSGSVLKKNLRFGFYSTSQVYVISIDRTQPNNALQTNTYTGTQIILSRQVLCSQTAPSATWEYEDGVRGSGIWRALDPACCAALSWCRTTGNQSALVVAIFGTAEYVLCANIQKQINTKTEYIRPLRSNMGHFPSAPPAPVSLTHMSGAPDSAASGYANGVFSMATAIAGQRSTTSFSQSQSVPVADTQPSTGINRDAAPPDDGLKELTSHGIMSDPCDASLTASEQCPICIDDLAVTTEGPAITLRGCKGHGFHAKCISQCIDAGGTLQCPVCSQRYGAPKTGTMPTNGQMTVHRNASQHLPGYSQDGIISIRYYFPDGIQGPEHPKPGERYAGTSRQAYLPDNQEGNEVLRLLQIAWQRRLTFQVNESVTLGPSGGIRVVWNGIHHKTEYRGTYGYPDQGYLSRVTDELKVLGVI